MRLTVLGNLRIISNHSAVAWKRDRTENKGQETVNRESKLPVNRMDKRMDSRMGNRIRMGNRGRASRISLASKLEDSRTNRGSKVEDSRKSLDNKLEDNRISLASKVEDSRTNLANKLDSRTSLVSKRDSRVEDSRRGNRRGRESEAVRKRVKLLKASSRVREVRGVSSPRISLPVSLLNSPPIRGEEPWGPSTTRTREEAVLRRVDGNSTANCGRGLRRLKISADN
jgi:hypothetical protein